LRSRPGYADVLVGIPSSGQANVYRGSAAPGVLLLTTPSILSDGALDFFGSAVAILERLFRLGGGG
jgi:hypothetical protein